MRMGRENPKWVSVLLLASLLLLMDAAEATQVLTLAKHAGGGGGGSSWKRRGEYDEWRRRVGIVCKCCDGATATCTPASSSAACSNRRCLPWKFH